ncbi:DUF1684 domain-containing protein [Bifidobacterium avesanii]|uniref:DUF1684 domain-containing protein n=1 Tax=Bifidobacterium avesanii TaxID=1798157 RepID=A0A7K3TI52_9BIFI|nr:DUF1684 domain-containing protein [Bifidobacterium avesanii]KAB8290974.1 hypothetical protein DSM100685_1236 [Bifidobacterium avesanii]NEG78741.1 DUF1684 domain-containing protein [Bifidobacterium avesanii]
MELFSRDPSITYDDLKNQSPEQFRAEWLEWKAKRDAYMREPYGWLSLVSIDWLENGREKTFASFPGTWRQDGDTVIYTPPVDGPTIVNRGEPITGPFTVKVPDVGDFNLEDFYNGDVRAQLIKRIGDDRQFAVRVRDPHSAGISGFEGSPAFEPDQRWVFPASFEPADHEDVTVGAVDGGLSHNETSIGTLHVDFDGTPRDLIVFEQHNDDSGAHTIDPETGERVYLNNRANITNEGNLLFRDQTSGKETYGGARVLGFDISDPTTVTYVDFNRAMNLPCAFTVFCTCPFAPFQNTLPLEIRAGEKTPPVFGSLED